MPSRINWNVHLGDLLADTLHLSATEFGAYFLLMAHYWRRGSLPDNDVKLKRIARIANFHSWQRVKPVVQAFFHVEDGQWKHKRIDRDLASADRKSAFASAAAAARWDGNGVGVSSAPKRSASKSSARNRVKPLKSNGADHADALPTLVPYTFKKELTKIVSSSLDASAWFEAKIEHPSRGESWRIFAYELFKRAPARALDIDIQAEKFREFNFGKKMSSAEWWHHWENWCRQAVQYACVNN